MTILALDQSSRISGWSIFENGELKHYGKFDADDNDLGKRLIYIREQVLKLINKYSVNQVVIEDIQLQDNVLNNVKTYKTLAEVIGVLEEAFTEHKISYSIIPSSIWKSALGIKGRDRKAQKQAAQNYVQVTYGKKPSQDECDAICIGTYAARPQSTQVLDWAD